MSIFDIDYISYCSHEKSIYWRNLPEKLSNKKSKFNTRVTRNSNVYIFIFYTYD